MGILIRSGGFLTTVQDAGRTGFQRFGVPVSGAADQRSLAYANLLVGNDIGEAALEVTMLGPQVELTESNFVAVTGADLSAQLNGGAMPMYRAIPVRKGDVLSFSMLKSGCRAYIAFAGGLDLPLVMESRSTYLKAKMGGLEGRKLDKDDFISFRAPVTSLKNQELRIISAEDFGTREKTVRVILGPQDDCFTSKGIETFLTTPYTVDNRSDRMGYRFEGEKIEHVKDGNIISDGIAFGAVQVPSEGKPIVMMPDRQTTGGYTKIANVIAVDLPIVAQSKAGDILRFEATDIQTAQRLYLEQIACFQELQRKFGADRLSNVLLKKYHVQLEGRTYEVIVEALSS